MINFWSFGKQDRYSSNMNVNEVPNRPCYKRKQIRDKNITLAANDDENKSQSSNDTFPTEPHSSYKIFYSTLPGLRHLKKVLEKSDLKA